MAVIVGYSMKGREGKRACFWVSLYQVCGRGDVLRSAVVENSGYKQKQNNEGVSLTRGAP